jgi:hypothetical protein
MEMDEIVERVGGWEGVLALRPGPGDGSPEISWGDVFFYVAPDGTVPASQPFATIVTKDYPGEPSAGLDRTGAFRVNIAVQRPAAPDAPQAPEAADPGEPDLLMAHPVYGHLGWVAVVNPAERTSEQVVAALRDAHQAALARWQRRHGTRETLR